MKVFKNFIEKYNHTLITYSIVTTVMLMDIEVNVQKYISNSWWDFLRTMSPSAQKWFSALFNPLLVSLIILCLLTIWNCHLTCRISMTAWVILPYSYAL